MEYLTDGPTDSSQQPLTVSITSYRLFMDSSVQRILLVSAVWCILRTIFCHDTIQYHFSLLNVTKINQIILLCQDTFAIEEAGMNKSHVIWFMIFIRRRVIWTHEVFFHIGEMDTSLVVIRVHTEI